MSEQRTGSTWTPAEDAIVIEALRAADGHVVAASRLCVGKIGRTTHAIQRRLGGMVGLRESIRPMRPMPRKSLAYVDSRIPMGGRVDPAPCPTLAALLAKHPVCMDCGGRWYSRTDAAGGGTLRCWHCATERWWRG